MKKGFKQLLAEANAIITTIPAAEAIRYLEKENVIFVDLRGPPELAAEGRRFLFYCASGGRSALATRRTQEMGLDPVAHIGGGISAWKQAGGSVEGVG